MGGASFLATMFDEEFASLGQSGLLLAAGDNVGASPPNSGLLEDMPTIDVENLWGLDATSLGNHEFDYGVERLLEHIDRAEFPFLATNVVEESTGELPDWLEPSKVFTVNKIKVGVIGAELESTPELVSAGATAGLDFLAEGPRIKAESERLEALGVNVQVVVIHQGTAFGSNPIGQTPGVAWDGPILGIADQLQDSTVDAMVVGHTHRVSNLMRGHILITEGINAGTSYSVLQLMVRGGDVAWAGGATRVAKTIGVARRADVQAVVAAANAEVAADPPAGRRAAGVRHPPDPTRLHESAMGNLVADAMLDKYADEAEAAYTNSGGLRADLPCARRARRRGLVRDHPRGAVRGPAVRQRDGRRDAHRRPDEDRVHQRVLAVLQLGGRTPAASRRSRACAPSSTATAPASSSTASGRPPKVDPRCRSPIGDTVRFVTNDFMYTGGDGYTVFTQGTDVLQKGDLLLDVVAAYIEASPEPVAPVVEGRITGP